jgi:hypothetical protein
VTLCIKVIDELRIRAPEKVAGRLMPAAPLSAVLAPGPAPVHRSCAGRYGFVGRLLTNVHDTH